MNQLEWIDNVTHREMEKDTRYVHVPDFVQELYQCIINFENYENPGSLEKFKLKLKELSDNSQKANLVQELSKAEIKGFTLAQHCSIKAGLEQFLQALLNASINPNEVLDGTGNEDNKDASVLLAARYGNFKVLKVLIDYNANIHLQEKNYSRTVNEGKGLKDLRAQMRYKQVMCYFDKCTKSQETILHLVLKRPLLKQLKDNNRRTSTIQNDDLWQSLKLEAKALDAKYNMCIDVLLSEDNLREKHEDDDFTDTTDKQIRRIINMKDATSNTPLHYAVHNWPQNVIIRLLRYAANVAVKNKNGDIPLTHISKDTIETFLDEYAMDISEISGMEISGDTTTASEKVSTNKISPSLNDYDISILLDDYKSEWVSQSRVNFKFGFLSPALSEAQLRHASQNSWELHILKDKNFELKSLKEMEVLEQICSSKEHRDLVTHPVLKAYTWIKWKIISKLYNRNLRVHILLALFLTWHIFAKFGGMRWNSTENNNTLHNPEDLFCSKNQDFNLFGGHGSVTSAIWNWNERKRIFLWNEIFVLTSILMILWMLFDHRDIIVHSNFGGIAKPPKQQSTTLKLSKRITTLFLALFSDALLILFMLLALLGSEEVLWFNIIALTSMQVIRECLQVCSSVKEYFMQMDNYFDLMQIASIYLIVVSPNEWFKDTCTLSVDIHTDCQTIQDEALNNCAIKRCISAWILVSMWSRIMCKVAKHPKFEILSVYMSMFLQVATSFLKLLLFYAIFLIAYGLGFYIMLHHDTKSRHPTKNATAGENNGAAEESNFNAPTSSLMQTAIFFIGELDELPTKGGNITKSLSYIYLLSFVFLMVMVLMNLLNGMAIRDTGIILQKSQIQGQTGLIETIAYTESVLLNNLTTLQRMGRKAPCFLSMVQKILLSSGVMLFETDYMKGKEEIVLPFEQESTQPGYKLGYKRIVNWFRMKLDDDACNQIIFEARKILEKNLSRSKNEVGCQTNTEF